MTSTAHFQQPIPLSIAMVGHTDPVFSEILKLRRLAYGHEIASDVDVVDRHSLHFTAKLGGDLLGSLRVTCRRDGQFENEAAYPAWLLKEHGEILCAASRMCVHPSLKGKTTIPSQLTHFSWAHVLDLGVRLNVSTARLDAIPFYLRQGAVFIRDSCFFLQKSETWRAHCGLIAIPACSNVRGDLATLFDAIDRPCNLQTSAHSRMYISQYREYSVLRGEYLARQPQLQSVLLGV